MLYAVGKEESKSKEAKGRLDFQTKGHAYIQASWATDQNRFANGSWEKIPTSENEANRHQWTHLLQTQVRPIMWAWEYSQVCDTSDQDREVQN